MKILVLNGPNLNMLGYTSKDMGTSMKLAELDAALATYGVESYDDIELVFYQTNHEGQLIDMVQKATQHYDGLIINPSAFCFYSLALREAVELADLPIVEVHLVDISKQKAPRNNSLISEVCDARFMGKALDSYKEALDFLIKG